MSDGIQDFSSQLQEDTAEVSRETRETVEQANVQLTHKLERVTEQLDAAQLGQSISTISQQVSAVLTSSALAATLAAALATTTLATALTSTTLATTTVTSALPATATAATTAPHHRPHHCPSPPPSPPPQVTEQAGRALGDGRLDAGRLGAQMERVGGGVIKDLAGAITQAEESATGARLHRPRTRPTLSLCVCTVRGPQIVCAWSDGCPP